MPSLPVVVDWINYHWMFLAFPTTLLFIIVKYVIRGSNNKTSSSSPLVDELLLWNWLALPVYAMHQFEEHGYDLYGRRYHFIEYFNNNFPVSLTPNLVTAINLVQVYWQFSYYAHLGETRQQPLYSALIHAVCAFNAIGGHLLPALLSGTYNPGCAQSLFMLPYSLYALRQYYLFTNKSIGWVAVCVFYGSVYMHGLSLALPAKLLSMGMFFGGEDSKDTYGVLGYLIWAVTMATIFPAIVVPFAPTDGDSTSSKPRQD